MDWASTSTSTRLLVSTNDSGPSELSNRASLQPLLTEHVLAVNPIFPKCQLPANVSGTFPDNVRFPPDRIKFETESTYSDGINVVPIRSESPPGL
jgi:hypothetical protein